MCFFVVVCFIKLFLLFSYFDGQYPKLPWPVLPSGEVPLPDPKLEGFLLGLVENFPLEQGRAARVHHQICFLIPSLESAEMS